MIKAYLSESPSLQGEMGDSGDEESLRPRLLAMNVPNKNGVIFVQSVPWKEMLIVLSINRSIYIWNPWRLW